MSARMFRAKSKLKDFSKKVWKPLCPKGLRGVERETLKFTFCVYMHLWQKMAKWYIKFFICGWGNFKPQDVVFGEFEWMVWWNVEIDDWLMGNWGKIDKDLTENRVNHRVNQWAMMMHKTIFKIGFWWNFLVNFDWKFLVNFE